MPLAPLSDASNYLRGIGDVLAIAREKGQELHGYEPALSHIEQYLKGAQV
jgi:hypothetical protein